MALELQSSYFLVAHGSRDPRPQEALDKLAELLCDRLASLTSSTPVVGTGTLELAPTSLSEQIQEFGEYTRSRQMSLVHLLPLFLLPGVHVMSDIPAEVAIAQQALGSDVRIDLRPYLGSHPGLGSLLAYQLVDVPSDAWILLSHGSSRAGANQPIEEIAAKLGAVPAYWSVAPTLGERVKDLVSAGRAQIGILPYFLFAGGITDAIALEVDQLREQFPSVDFHLAEPLGATAELAHLIWDLF